MKNFEIKSLLIIVVLVLNLLKEKVYQSLWVRSIIVVHILTLNLKKHVIVFLFKEGLLQILFKYFKLYTKICNDDIWKHLSRKFEIKY